MTQVRFLKPEYFIWPIVPLGMMATLAIAGAPHFIWSYDWRVAGWNPQDDFRNRYYTRCTYINTRDAITEYPRDGRCGWVRFGK